VVEILYSSDKDISAEYLDYLVSLIENHGFKAKLNDIKNDSLNGDVVKSEKKVDLYVVLGGDGSIIRAAHRALKTDAPILGINFGTVGCLAELEQTETERLTDYFTGRYYFDERKMIEAELIRDGNSVTRAMTAINDVVIYHGACAKLVDSELYCDGSHVAHFRSDRVIISTPTGSTGYSMSAGGPVISPDAPVMCATPICAHSLDARPLIFSDKSQLDIVVKSRVDGKMKLTVDGFDDIDLKNGDIVRIRRSEASVKLVRIGDKADKGQFYKRVIRKIQ